MLFYDKSTYYDTMHCEYINPCYSRPIQSHYFPTLHQLKYELEDGYNPTDDDGAVRFGFEDTDFPDFSWRGYAVFSRIQPEVSRRTA